MAAYAVMLTLCSIIKIMSPILPRVDAALFDLDGTLVETNIDFPLMKDGVMQLASEYGVYFENPQSIDILAVLDRTVEYLLERGEIAMADSARKRGMEFLEEIELRHAGQTSEIPFAREILNELRSRDIGIGIVTRNCRKACEISLEITGLSADVMICREDSVRHKPHPEPFEIALGALNARADASVMVGDHIMDISGGKAAGIATIGFLRETREADFFDAVAPNYVARSLGEVLCAIIDCDS